jgi:anhydro-N-acetylmuramic acid kinase
MPHSGIMIGLMSGTSADGIDVCIAEIEISKGARRPRLGLSILHADTFPYKPALRRAILSASTVEDVCRLNFAVAESFSEVALTALRRSRLPRRRILAISSHGQTLFHAPAAPPIGGFPSRSTLQVGDIAVIAARTGLPCVGDFRTKDVALGGQGAPLVPFVDFLLTPPEGAVWLNIGGIANITVVPPGSRASDVIAYDTGPGNTLIDRVVRKASHGKRKCDLGGRLALEGRVDERLLGRMLSHRYLKRRPPKSTGPEEFGEAFLARYVLPKKLEDACATLSAFTADTIASAICLSRGRRTRLPVYASGGGVYNRAIITRLQASLRPAEIGPPPVMNAYIDAKEAFAFAVLGLCTLFRIPNNLPSATGASRPAVLGKIAYPG